MSVLSDRDTIVYCSLFVLSCRILVGRKVCKDHPEGEEQKTKWDREKINKAAEEAYQKAQKEKEQLPKESKERIQEDEKEVEVTAEEIGEEKSELSKQKKEKSEREILCR